jgi:2-oxoglutarate ferredoxin oxidoreductase subunit beta
MTGGQMAPTTLIGQKSTTSPKGRDPEVNGYPVRVSEMLASHEGAYYIERVALNNTRNILAAKRAIKKAFEYQKNGHGLNFVEILSTCPTNWGLNPTESLDWLEENMIPYYPLGVKKDKEARKDG